MSTIARYPGLNAVSQDNTGRGITCKYIEIDGGVFEHNVPLSAARTFVNIKNVNLANINVIFETTRPMIGDELIVFANAAGGFVGTSTIELFSTIRDPFEVDQESVSSASFVFNGDIWVQVSIFKQTFTPPPE